MKYAKSIEAYAKENKLTFNPRCELVKEGDEKHIYLKAASTRLIRGQMTTSAQRRSKNCLTGMWLST